MWKRDQNWLTLSHPPPWHIFPIYTININISWLVVLKKTYSRFDQAIILMNYEKYNPFLHMTSKRREDKFSCGRMFPVLIDPDKWDHGGQRLDDRHWFASYLAQLENGVQGHFCTAISCKWLVVTRTLAGAAQLVATVSSTQSIIYVITHHTKNGWRAGSVL